MAEPLLPAWQGPPDYASDSGTSVSDTAYDATSWNGVTDVAPSKNAVRDKFESIVSGAQELGYAEITSLFGTSSTTPVDVTGLAVTVTVATRPIVVKFQGRMYTANTGSYAVARIREGSTTLGQAVFYSASGTNDQKTIYSEVRVAPAAGSHTYKITLEQYGGGAANILGAADDKAFIQVVEV